MKDLYALAIFGLLAVSLGLAVRYAGTQRDLRKQTANDVAELKETLSSLSSQIVLRHELDVAIRESRTETINRIQEAMNEDPALARYLGERIPDGLRDAHLDRPSGD